MESHFKAFILTHRQAPLAIREPLALQPPACDALLERLHRHHGLRDVLVLSTCNRTEIYYQAPTDQRRLILAELAAVTGLPDVAAYDAYFTSLSTGETATQHLFEVALGLQAQVVGDLQIGHQVKRAYQRSVAAGAAGPYLHRLLQGVLAAHKRVQHETAFRDGAASTSYAALELVEELTAHLPRPRVLVVGLGEIGTDLCRHFAKRRGRATVQVCNRTDAVARRLAAECGLLDLPFAHLIEGLRTADVVVSGVAAPYFFTPGQLAALPVMQPKFLLDLALPRSVDPAVEQVPGVVAYNLEDLQSRASAALAQRLAAIPQVRAIIAEGRAELAQWSAQHLSLPVIQALKTRLEELSQQEIGRVRRQQHLSAAETAYLEDLSRGLLQKLLRQPVLQLKAAAGQGHAEPLAATLAALFALPAPATLVLAD
ncbi:glutamyl-tRNA reductase [Hymenobacter sp. NST-14]|uniref:glutamyl-tRNA reductase n=1 Tax=Hymenobacter piscis TaxID=2839984 RepID=UPI001C028E2F|nr:glutamyl-tRNA reductase [Hymenobacter piscis]MBT9395013.1 glutamyl-tRNA reductase [Hymenobacter piscis]